MPNFSTATRAKPRAKASRSGSVVVFGWCKNSDSLADTQQLLQPETVVACHPSIGRCHELQLGHIKGIGKFESSKQITELGITLNGTMQLF